MNEPAWHQALAYAVTGQRQPELGYQAQPDLAVLAGRLRTFVAADATFVGPPHRVPDDLMRGIGAAQFQAALAELRVLLAGRLAGPVVSSRPLTAEELRLDADRPPHHG
jgi:hypothetical protein